MLLARYCNLMRTVLLGKLSCSCLSSIPVSFLPFRKETLGKGMTGAGSTASPVVSMMEE